VDAFTMIEPYGNASDRAGSSDLIRDRLPEALAGVDRMRANAAKLANII
jgi:hypothetical protein